MSQPESWVKGDSISYSNYRFSSYGRVYSCGKNALLTGNLHSGYINVRLINDSGEQKAKRVHQLIALIFLGPKPDENSTVDHINRNRQDNCVWNLRWATKSEQNINQAKPSNRVYRQIYQYNSDLTAWQKWLSLNSAAKTLGLNSKSISNACKSEQLYGGYYWFYSEDVEIYENEVFRNIPGYSKYQVSNLGRVKYPYGRIVNWDC